MSGDVNGLHHVGHIARSMNEAIELYRRLGFSVSAPVHPVLPGAAEAFGVANAHVHFPGGFIELVAVIGDGSHLPAGARPLPLEVPEERRAGLEAAIRATVANIAAFAERFEGVHIMIADTGDLDGVAARLTAGGVHHGGVHAVQRPVETGAGIRMEPARYLEISDPDLTPGRVPEGRIGFAENRPGAGSLTRVHHPNGATGLAECVLCVDDAALPEVKRRYATYFEGSADLGQADLGEANPGRAALGQANIGRPGAGRADAGRAGAGRAGAGRAGAGRAGAGRAGAGRADIAHADVGHAHTGPADDEAAGVTVVAASVLGEMVPGERPAALPAFVAYAVTVRDVAAAERLLLDNGVPTVRTADGEVFVPARAALGVAIIFRQEGTARGVGR
ncbi:VOC family protein [Nonomuraea fuscirosea]|uniref:VOC family protein n=1 Tax=Nonomuraea fuscirosea TaxID=1291556 RepID=UPI00342C6E73